MPMAYDVDNLAAEGSGAPAHEAIAILSDGQVIARSRMWQVLASGDSNVVITVPDLRLIRAVLDVQFWSLPDTSVKEGYMDKRIHGNVVGMTIYEVEAGTTLIVEVIALGPP